jgi:uncharacterized protein (DUF2235 family)
MRYYNPGDNIYIFGFSRGAYTARFLAEMLDDVGLLPHGNEEMVDFAWDIFAKWQTRPGYEKPRDHHAWWEGWRERRNMKKYEHARALGKAMSGFRKTFSREIEPIRFLGLFDTVNSVPQFETPWMKRKSFPYTARSDAREIWHAVSIDERRVKFRPDLIYGSEGTASTRREREKVEEVRRRIALDQEPQQGQQSRIFTELSLTSTMTPISPEEMDTHNHATADQEVHEVWFAGNHGDVGGGWEDKEGCMSLSHVPLVWIVRAAHKAGVKFDLKKLAKMGIEVQDASNGTQPTLAAKASTESETETNLAEHDGGEQADGQQGSTRTDTKDATVKVTEVFEPRYDAMLSGSVHDCLSNSSGLAWHEVIRWNLMEWLPFRRMELNNGKWEPMRWPLTCGEQRDIPDESHVHASVIERLRQNPKYRPKNLILGGGRESDGDEAKVFEPEKWEELASAKGDIYDRVYVRRTVQLEELSTQVKGL